jgi:glycosyltransferase involved in cell wall biosynthesis
MRILYDGQVYAAQPTGGINRYFTNIIDRLPATAHPTLTTTYRPTHRHYPTHPHLRLQEYRGFRPHRISHRLRTQYFRWIADRTPFDIFHPTYYGQLTNRPLDQARPPIVLTVYDMIHEQFSDIFDPEGHTIRAKQAAIVAADAIICISHSTRADLLKYFPQVAAKTTVTHLASEFSADWANGDEPVPAAPYFLYVGGRTKEYKNFDTLLNAFAKAATVNPEIQLCVVGAPFDAIEQQQITALKLADRLQHYEYASDRHLAKLYRCATAFIYPSLYEGFGIPPLEAMACGTVVVAADSSSIPEVVGDAGILFPPQAVGDLADIMLHLLNAPSDRDRLIAKGNDRHQQFSWDKTAAQTVEVYQSLL